MSFHSLNYMLTANQNSEQTKLLGYAKKNSCKSKFTTV